MRNLWLKQQVSEFKPNGGEAVRFSKGSMEAPDFSRVRIHSSSKWLEIGYKDGGKIIAIINLYADVLIIKSNRRVYRLQGEYPNWIVSEVSRNIECSGRLSCCAIADRVFILGQNEMQMLTTMENYGDVKPSNVASLVIAEIQKLPNNTLIKFIPPLNQIWLLGNKGVVMMFDLVTQSWFKRIFNSTLIDVIPVGNEVFIIKADRISKLDENVFYDTDKPLQWQFKGQRMISQHDFLLKRLGLTFAMCHGYLSLPLISFYFTLRYLYCFFPLSHLTICPAHRFRSLFRS